MSREPQTIPVHDVARLEVAVRGKLEPLRAKMTKLADRGWLHKRPDERFTARR
ncbi:hypothetical protein [Streptomyces sp. NEAU-174]|uniref:hypothetical protein n=1 Tax=Streptomyces sp. NEAU-174 TaxID=3458254 RepID=UPI004043D202